MGLLYTCDGLANTRIRVIHKHLDVDYYAAGTLHYMKRMFHASAPAQGLPWEVDMKLWAPWHSPRLYLKNRNNTIIMKSTWALHSKNAALGEVSILLTWQTPLIRHLGMWLWIVIPSRRCTWHKSHSNHIHPETLQMGSIVHATPESARKLFIHSVLCIILSKRSFIARYKKSRWSFGNTSHSPSLCFTNTRRDPEVSSHRKKCIPITPSLQSADAVIYTTLLSFVSITYIIYAMHNKTSCKFHVIAIVNSSVI